MKKLKYIIVTFLCGILFVSCNDELEEAYDEAGEATPILNDITYELTSADFAGFDEAEDDIYEIFNAFPSIEDAEIKIAPILSDKTDVAVNGLNIFVDVKYNTGLNTNDEDLLNFVTARKYELENSDYPTLGASAFLIAENEEETLTAIAARENPAPKENDITRVEYLRYTEAPVDGFVVINQTNFSTFQGWTPINIVGEQEWSEGGDFNNVQMSGFNGSSAVPNEDWLISPEIDLSDENNIRIFIEQTYRFGDDLSNLKVLIADNYPGTGVEANWEEITFTTLPTGEDFDYVTSEKVGISNFDGKKVNIALNYVSTDNDNFLWRVRQIALEAGGLEGPTEKISTFLKYNGTEWEIVEDDSIYLLQDADYDAFGFVVDDRRNFSNSISPDNYLPAFLSNQRPFAQEEDQVLVIYDFFFGSDTGTLATATQYVFTNGTWLAPKETLKFTYKEGRWEPNNAEPYEFIEADYDLVVAELTSVENLADEVGNLGRFGNFNRRVGGDTFWDEKELLLAFNVVLKARFPDSEIGDLYEVTIAAFPTGTETYQLELSDDEDYIYVE